MKVLTVVGARPQFIKAAPVSIHLRQRHREVLVHTGQHYDYEMSGIFFSELSIPTPDVSLGIGSGSHAQQTARMLQELEAVMQAEKPDLVLLYGDTNSTLAGALAAVKLQLPVAHVEAGLRSYNRAMPEEHNRVITDHCADLLMCPTQTAVHNLCKEGITRGVHYVGDTMYDATLAFMEMAEQHSRILQKLGLVPREYLLATVHRPYNTDNAEHLGELLSAFLELGEKVIFPIHPRTRGRLDQLDPSILQALAQSSVVMITPVGYLDMLVLEKHARLVMTDSGGIQKEAFFCGVPCVTLRPETEWIETVQSGWNVLVGANRRRIVDVVQQHVWPTSPPPALFGDGCASQKIVNLIG
jgi:UDP-N-acetylglucosamine 2-epimerase